MPTPSDGRIEQILLTGSVGIDSFPALGRSGRRKCAHQLQGMLMAFEDSPEILTERTVNDRADPMRLGIKRGMA